LKSGSGREEVACRVRVEIWKRGSLLEDHRKEDQRRVQRRRLDRRGFLLLLLKTECYRRTTVSRRERTQARKIEVVRRWFCEQERWMGSQ